MSVLAHLGHEDARAAAFLLGEFIGEAHGLFHLGVVHGFRCIDAADGAGGGFVSAEDEF